MSGVKYGCPATVPSLMKASVACVVWARWLSMSTY